MDSDREYRPGQVPLAGFGDQQGGDQPASSRRDGVRHARRMSNWTLAALIAGTGAATVALAHQAWPSAAVAGSSSATAATGGQPAVNGASGPAVSHSVATTSGSGATVTTTTKTVNGRTVIVRTLHPAPYHDN
jgi:hypothetical protein